MRAREGRPQAAGILAEQVRGMVAASRGVPSFGRREGRRGRRRVGAWVPVAGLTGAAAAWEGASSTAQGAMARGRCQVAAWVGVGGRECVAAEGKVSVASVACVARVPRIWPLGQSPARVLSLGSPVAAVGIAAAARGAAVGAAAAAAVVVAWRWPVAVWAPVAGKAGTALPCTSARRRSQMVKVGDPPMGVVPPGAVVVVAARRTARAARVAGAAVMGQVSPRSPPRGLRRSHLL